MPTLKEPVPFLEGQMSEQSCAMRRLDALDDKMSRQFIWVVGLQVTILVAAVGALLTSP
jgi:hypothetical protein